LATLGPSRSVAAGLFGSGLFFVLYPALVWLFAPRRLFAARHLYFLGAGLVLLLLGVLCIWMGRGRADRP
jgi:hypothetical protein